MIEPDWVKRHRRAMLYPSQAEAPHVHLYRAITATLDRGWPTDGYAVDYLIDIVRAARALLNMDAGRLHCGTLDSFYCGVLKACGLKDEEI